MSEKSVTKDDKEAKEVKKSPSVSTYSMPMVAPIEDILRAIRILSEHGGQARMNRIKTSFGTKPSDKNMLSWALNAAVAFDLIQPHKVNAPYMLTDDGKRFLGLSEDQQKVMLLGKFLGFQGYRTILVAMKNNQDRSLKKQTITDMWLQVRDNIKLATRQGYTTSFASVGAWCGALTDSGQICSLNPEAEKILTQVLKGEGPKAEQPSLGTPTPPEAVPLAPALLPAQCPHCGKSEIGVENEELLQALSSTKGHSLIVKSTYYCRGCSRTFSLIGQRPVKIVD